MPDIKTYIWEKTAGFIEDDPRNTLTAHDSMRIYDSPLMEIASIKSESWHLPALAFYGLYVTARVLQ